MTPRGQFSMARDRQRYYRLSLYVLSAHWLSLTGGALQLSPLEINPMDSAEASMFR